MKAIANTSASKEKTEEPQKSSNSAEKKAAIEATLAAAKPVRVAAASLADILGFNPAVQAAKSPYDDPMQVPEKYRRYYKLLLELRSHLTGQIDQHAEDTLKRSSKDDAGDLSSYGQHMADAGTDTFNRDFALSLVANEQEALAEIESAITRITKGTYGICEVTEKPIAKERLLAVPFTRYSAEAQKQIERNHHRVRTQAGLFGEFGEDGATITEASDDD
ncbi:MAG: TraR/DksA C4-type zinc finger protein [Candidatus Synoicihabitans palmerolidicus]|nr:TraR/DksA C4-type zinc finger protein [Candidatus Synoicihabitans palmerolidicus]